MYPISFSRVALCISSFCALFLWGCTRDDNDAPLETMPAEIAVSAGFVSPASTRGSIYRPESVDADFSFPVSIVRIDEQGPEGFMPYTAASPLAGRVAYDESDSEVWMRFNSTQYYLPYSNYHRTKVMAWHPPVRSAEEATDFAVIEGGERATVTIPIDGDTDILWSDMWIGNWQAPLSGRGVPFLFHHLLTMVRFKVFTTSTDMPTVWGRITSIAFADTPSECVVTLPGVNSGTTFPMALPATHIAFPTDAVDDLLIIPADPMTGDPVLGYETEGNKEYLPIPYVTGDTDAEGMVIGAQPAGYGMVAPVSATGALRIAITTEQHTAPLIIDITPADVGIATAGFLAGHAYTLSLEFTATGIFPTVTLAKWGETPEKDNVDLGTRPDDSDAPSGSINDWDSNGSDEDGDILVEKQ